MRLFLPAESGRQRFNVLGALQAVSHELVTVVNDTYINAESVCLLLTKIAASYADKLITIVPDSTGFCG